MTYSTPAGQKQGIDALCGRLWAGVTRCLRTVHIDEDTWKFRSFDFVSKIIGHTARSVTARLQSNLHYHSERCSVRRRTCWDEVRLEARRKGSKNGVDDVLQVKIRKNHCRYSPCTHVVALGADASCNARCRCRGSKKGQDKQGNTHIKGKCNGNEPHGAGERQPQRQPDPIRLVVDAQGLFPHVKHLRYST